MNQVGRGRTTIKCSKGVKISSRKFGTFASILKKRDLDPVGAGKTKQVKRDRLWINGDTGN